MPEKNIRKTARLIEFDIIKGLAIYLVLCGHSILHLSSDESSGNVLYLLICSFHMPLFMLISGFFSERALMGSFKTLINKKFWQLLYPTITFGILFFIIDIILWGHNPKDFLGYLWGIFWFLKSCFLCFIIFWICLKITKKQVIWGSILGLLVSQFLPIFKLTYMMPFFILGFVINRNKNFVYKRPLYLFLISSLCFILLFVWNYAKGFNEVPLMGIKTSLLNGNMMFLKDYGIYHTTRLFLGLTGSLAVISFIIILKNVGVIRTGRHELAEYGSETLLIYIFQTLLLEDILSNIIDLHDLNIYIFSLIFVPLISYVLMELCYYISKWINRGIISKLLISGIKNKRSNNRNKDCLILS